MSTFFLASAGEPTQCSQPCPLGWFTLSTHLSTDQQEVITQLRFSDHGTPRAPSTPLHLAACQQLDQYFKGQRRQFSLSLAPSGTAFQHQVWQALLTLEYGQHCSYKFIAEHINNPNAVRAVGLANSRNPIALIIPCHRVIGANGKLVGYAGGIERKAWLLEHEQKK
ncbi:methylated-DNA--[protein]-cysteine S-methyltransferase [Oceanisphaera avium]|uniref:Methylated-DNA--protein-cysteine methyltransferase n=1 Tax=Oceanisphaera avium TaxID=1903694 RepID=A0A1Y0CZM8_9GAMM|nr:methylated-DNA--[protein]-cysteine S-methyltransferase [Oceanisphaera avium]ART80780.1 hypothetical protein CBP12_11960 [Oceanisphaera avium]